MFEDRRQQPNRTIMLFGYINKESIKEVLERIIYINEYDDDQINLFGDKYQPEAIKLRICSEGGELSPTIGLVEEILHSKCPIITVADGEICSSAFLIFISGHRRYLKFGSTVMIHASSGGFGGSLKTIQNDIKSYERMENHMKLMIKDLTNIPDKIIEKYYNEQVDYYFTEEECMKYGICDEIYGTENEVEEKPKKVTKSKKKKSKKK